MLIVEKRCCDKPRAYVGETNVVAFYMGKLVESIDISVLETLCGAVGWCYPQSFSACDRRNYGDVPSVLALLEIVE